MDPKQVMLAWSVACIIIKRKSFEERNMEPPLLIMQRSGADMMSGGSEVSGLYEVRSRKGGGRLRG